MSYDVKYRQQAIVYWNEGHSKRATAQVFGVNASTLQKWKSQLKETGDLKPRKRREVWRKIEPLRLKKYVEQHPDAYLKEIVQEFGCTDAAILTALRRLKISRKKTTQYKEINEDLRKAFAEQLKSIPPERLICVDESGFDLNVICAESYGILIPSALLFEPLSNLVDYNCRRYLNRNGTGLPVFYAG